jgi:hypothetical protein
MATVKPPVVCHDLRLKQAFEQWWKDWGSHNPNVCDHFRVVALPDDMIRRAMFACILDWETNGKYD